MSNSSANAPAVDSSSIHKFPYKWWMKDLAKVPKNGLTVFPAFLVVAVPQWGTSWLGTM